MIKEISLIDYELFSGDKLDTMVETALRTLELLMKSLLLTQEHSIIAAAYKQKLDFKTLNITKVEKQ